MVRHRSLAAHAAIIIYAQQTTYISKIYQQLLIKAKTLRQ